MRKLAAIMFTDIVGYTALMGEDETKALQLLQKNRGLLKPIIEQFRGEWLKEMGDGTLSAFGSAVEAVNCALAIQTVLKDDPDLKLRIGIHVGDVVVEGGDVFGDGVNVASRLEPLAEAGSICVSERVYEDIRNKPGIEATSLGEKKLKGVDHPVKVYAVTEVRAPLAKQARAALQPLGRRWWTWAGAAAVVAVIALMVWRGGIVEKAAPVWEPALGPKSIAVLPFANLSDSKEDEYFSDGMTEDILTHLAKIGDLSVIARTSVMQYKNTEKRIKVIARELGVAAVLEGSVRRAGNRVRITSQLIEAETDRHLWAETYDRDLTDIFAIQSDVAAKIATALKIVLQPEEKERIERIPTHSLVAYDYYLQALDYYNRSVEEKDTEIAIDMLNKAVEADSAFIEAYALLIELHLQQFGFGFASLEERKPLARQALERMETIDPTHPSAHHARGYYYKQALDDYQRSAEEFAIANQMEPGNVLYLFPLGITQVQLGLFKEGLANLERTLELDPRSSAGFQFVGRFFSGFSLEKAASYFDRAIELAPDVAGSYIERARAEYYLTGSADSARQILTESSDLVDPSAFGMTFVWLNIWDGRYEEALDQLGEVEENEFWRWYPRGYTTNDALTGLILSRLGRSTEARVHFEKALRLMQTRMREGSVTSTMNKAMDRGALGLIYAHLGMKAAAIQEGKKAIDQRPVALALSEARFLARMAEIYTILGETELAIDYLMKSAELPTGVKGYHLRFENRWDPLRENPRFQALMEKYGDH